MNNCKIILFITFIFFFACSEKENNEDLAPKEVVDDQGEGEDTKTKYSSPIKSIISNNCLSCHSGNSPKANLDLSNYSNLKDAIENGNLLERINAETNFMPPNNKLSTSNRELISKWKDDGYLE
ncbi:MAG: hypothetical protein HRT66_11610 [Flavobacteriaceae bacterium]|nr:hypothetical protein [Flavobacteriaceae bacterium]